MGVQCSTIQRYLIHLLHRVINEIRFPLSPLSLTYWGRDNGRHFADDIFKWIFLNESVWIPIKISLKFVPKGPINKIPALVQIMAWCRPGDKPLSEPMMPQWVNIVWKRQNGHHITDDIFKRLQLLDFASLKIVPDEAREPYLNIFVPRSFWQLGWHKSGCQRLM